VVVADRRQDLVELRRHEDPLAERRMLLDVRSLGGRQWAGLEQHVVADADLAHVMHLRCELDDAGPLLGKAEDLRERCRELRDVLGVVLGRRIARIDDGRESTYGRAVRAPACPREALDRVHILPRSARQKPAVLIIDDDPDIRDVLYLSLAEYYSVFAARNGKEGLEMVKTKNPDLIITDYNMPVMNGPEFCRQLRRDILLRHLPIIMLTGKGETKDMVTGIESGADDYLIKPCNPRELMARLRAILRRTIKIPISRPIIEQHNIVVDCAQRHVSVSGNFLELTNAEFNILEMLIKSPGQAFSKEELTEYALGRKYTAYDRSIDVHISNLRNKLGDNPQGEPIVKTVRGFGYMLLFQSSEEK